MNREITRGNVRDLVHKGLKPVHWCMHCKTALAQAEVEYEDGTKRIVPYPRMKNMSLGEKFVKERYRKFVERGHTDEFSWKWPVFAQRMAFLAANDPKNLPSQVILRRHWNTYEKMSDPKPEGYNDYAYYKYVVDQDKLKRDKGW